MKEIPMIRKIRYTDINTHPIIVDDCPINIRVFQSGYKMGKSYADVFDDCSHCQYCAKVERGIKMLGDVPVETNYLNVHCKG